MAYTGSMDIIDARWALLEPLFLPKVERMQGAGSSRIREQC
jgi:hypothetical protein